MNNNQRLLIRLIDVALIILLGFIAISKLSTEQIVLPDTGSPSNAHPEIVEAGLHIYKDHFRIDTNYEKTRFSSLQELERQVAKIQKTAAGTGRKFTVRIEAHKKSTIQSLVDVLDMCQRQRIEKSINYDSIDYGD